MDEEVLEQLIRNLMDKILGDFPLLIHIVQMFLKSCLLQESLSVILYELPGFAMNTLGVMEKNTVIRLAIQVLAFLSSIEFYIVFYIFLLFQLWQEKCPYGLEDENTNLGRCRTVKVLVFNIGQFAFVSGT